MKSQELRQKFMEFFEKRGHKIVPSSSLIPDDPSVLLTTAGMQQFKKYYTEPSLAPSPSVVSIQKCFRTSDIDEVGDESHLTFFEMLGNFSFGGYFKEEAIKYAKEFLESVGLKIDYVTVFAGDEETPFDEESYKIWQSLGVKDIRKAGREDNFWGPTGAEGPCGPTTEIYINGVEIWNIVFNEYYKKPHLPTGRQVATFEKLKTPGVDTGMGLERLVMVSQNKKTIFETDLFVPLMRQATEEDARKKRIIADHIRAITFLISDGVRPSNKEQGYVLRRLMRRVITYGADGYELLKVIADDKNYEHYKLDFEKMVYVYNDENKNFAKALHLGLKELEKLEAEKIDAKKLLIYTKASVCRSKSSKTKPKI
ncbi:MAG: alanine--tRNA ligase-related protein [Candidatus Giovannonibacteria bacterium]|nr:alanine--tRNA ligase-related protein [Candidatus Giovannonibacteria bacterium]